MVCPDCNREMTQAVSCTLDGGRVRWGQETLLGCRAQFAAQRGVEDPIANPVPMDDPEADGFFELCNIGPHVGDRKCPDCKAPPGGLHHFGCDTEECPECHLQAIGCECGGMTLALARARHVNGGGGMKVTADEFARLSASLGHKPADIERTVRQRYPDVDAVRVVEQALKYLGRSKNR